MPRILLFAAAFGSALAAHGPAKGQVRCTMPNGTVIEQKLASTCPRGAVSGITPDGKPVALLPPVTRDAQKPQPSPAERAPPTATRAQPTEYDDARAICAILLSTNAATTCEVDANVFSRSVIDATVTGGMLQASSLCQQIKTTFKENRRPISGSGNWELRMFSPFGSGDRPMARCVL